jgi:FKBP12-rapamycin complex-associated protein
MDNLRRFWIINSLTSREDWLQWLGVLRNQFIRDSPAPSIRCCAVLAETNETLSKYAHALIRSKFNTILLRELFNAAFMSIWTEVRESEQDELTNHLMDVITLCPHPEPKQAILNLAEFMDHSEKGPLPISHSILCKCAEQTQAYAKALRYKEQEIITCKNGEPSSDDCQILITLFNKLNLEEGAAGVVQYAERHQMDISVLFELISTCCIIDLFVCLGTMVRKTWRMGESVGDV